VKDAPANAASTVRVTRSPEARLAVRKKDKVAVSNIQLGVRQTPTTLSLGLGQFCPYRLRVDLRDFQSNHRLKRGKNIVATRTRHRIACERSIRHADR
jgi:hypothetical protein